MPPIVLTIGSSDSSGGAGIQGDIKALASIGCYAATVLVGVTAQNTVGIAARHAVPVAFVGRQLDAVVADLRIDAVKVGATWSLDHVAAIAGWLPALGVPIVVDPVMVAASGASLADPEIAAAVVARLFPIAAVVTPNLDEARALAGDPGAGPEALAGRLLELGARAAVVTCGGAGDRDWFAEAGAVAPVPRGASRTGAEHGAGCAHSALIAGLLARGVPLRAAVEDAARRAARGVHRGLVSIGRGVHPIDVLGLGAGPGEGGP